MKLYDSAQFKDPFFSLLPLTAFYQFYWLHFVQVAQLFSYEAVAKINSQ